MPEQPGRQKQHRAQKGKHGIDSDADQPERLSQQPHNRPQKKRQQRQRPAQNEQDAPPQKTKKCCHRIIPVLSSIGGKDALQGDFAAVLSIVRYIAVQNYQKIVLKSSNAVWPKSI